jgi:signal transduction histidine kinase
MAVQPNCAYIIPPNRDLILSDVGRPLGHIVSNLVSYARMVEDIQAVLNTLIPKEVDVQTTAGKHYMMRFLFNLLSNAVKFTPDGGSVALKTRFSDLSSKSLQNISSLPV